jgi:hypothetical protein
MTQFRWVSKALVGAWYRTQNDARPFASSFEQRPYVAECQAGIPAVRGKQ